GMSWEDVLASLGPPLDEGPYDGGYIVRYSRGIESSSYWRRVICYDRKGGTVRRVHTGLFVS
ncbi:MAG TPA: hypothetical protein VK824_00445, partial [Planctomycetota bacterium]|nr:hypothetical protein [Planctomycetota bacterium]